jgi:hypothetical protein
MLESSTNAVTYFERVDCIPYPTYIDPVYAQLLSCVCPDPISSPPTPDDYPNYSPVANDLIPEARYWQAYVLYNFYEKIVLGSESTHSFLVDVHGIQMPNPNYAYTILDVTCDSGPSFTDEIYNNHYEYYTYANNIHVDIPEDNYGGITAFPWCIFEKIILIDKVLAQGFSSLSISVPNVDIPSSQIENGASAHIYYMPYPEFIVELVETKTGTGTAYFITDSGIIQNLTAVPEGALPSEGKPNFRFPHGFFSFNITGLTAGQTVTVTITLPGYMPTTTQYWKCHTPEGLYQIPMSDNDGDNIITIQLTDGGTGDDDGVANGIIVDQGGPGTPLKINETMYKNSITQRIDASKIRFIHNAVNEEWAKGSKWPIPMELMYWQKKTKYLIEVYIDGAGNVTGSAFRRWGSPITEIPYELAEQSLASLPPGFALDP